MRAIVKVELIVESPSMADATTSALEELERGGYKVARGSEGELIATRLEP